MWRIGFLISCALALVVTCLSSGNGLGQTEGRPAADAKAVRIGTFNRTELLVAYYGSTVHDREMKKLLEEHEAAKAAGDAKKVAELEAKGAASQELAHKQLAGEAALNNVLQSLQEKFPSVARESGVAAIVERILHKEASVEEVDVTALLVKQFESAKKKQGG